MAKLKAPLLSFGASGKLADTLVYFPWKGLAVVRSYVIPPPAGPDHVDMIWGYSPTSLINTVTDAVGPSPWTFAPANNVAGRTIYARFRAENAGGAARGWSGIYPPAMAKPPALPAPPTIRRFRGLVDFYTWKGIPCARRWPNKQSPDRFQPAELAAAKDFGALAREMSRPPPYVVLTATRLARNVPWTWRDLTTAAAFNNLIRWPTP